MALARVKNFVEEALLFADLNAEFNSILNNPISLISPYTAAVDWDGYTQTLDAAGVTTLVSSAAISFNFTSGAKTGTPATTGSVSNWSAQTFTDNNTAASGTATNYVAFAYQRPTLAATNASVTTTNAATWYIGNSPAAGTNQTITNAYALWIDDGNVRFDGTLTVAGDFGVAATKKFYLDGVALTGNTYIVENGADVIAFVAGGVTAISLNASALSIAATNKFNLDGSLTGDTYIVESSANVLDLYAGGTNMLRLTQSSGATIGGDLSVVTVSGGAIATQAQQETGTATNLLVTPGRQQFHPSACKAWAKLLGSTWTVSIGYNVSSITDNAVGDFTVNFTTAFSSGNYSVGYCMLADDSTFGVRSATVSSDNAPTTSACRIYTGSTTSVSKLDVTGVTLGFFGDQ